MAKVTAHSVHGDHVYTFDQEATIGRHPRSTICLHDPMVSKHHAVIRKVGRDYYFEDLGSTNGSFVGGIQITRQKLHDGDHIDLGKVTLVFHAQTEAERLANMVNLSAVEKGGEVQDRINVSAVGNFLPEKDISSLHVLRDDYEKLRLGYELLQTIGFERDLPTTLDKVTDKLLHIFSAGRCVLMLRDPETGKLKPSSVSTAGHLEDAVSVSESVLNEVIESKSALLLMDTQTDSRFSHASSLILHGIRSVMCAPILHQGEVIGVVHLDSSQGQGQFTRKDLQLLTGIVHYVAMAVANGWLMKKIEKEAKAKAQFERLLSPAVVEQVMSGKVTLEKEGGELRDVTILFADIRGFTSMSRRSDATSIVAMLNRYFEIVVDVVFKFQGTVDKYIGDEIMVLFGAPVDIDHPADRAVSCALEMQRVLKEFNQKRVKKGEDPIEIGIGINSGKVVVGSIGSSQTMQYTCIGDAVNIASHLTRLARPGQVLITENTFNRLHADADYELLSPMSLKGIEHNLNIYWVKKFMADTHDPKKVSN